MRENLKQSRRKDDILIGYYFVCVYICLKESKKEKKASDLAFSLTPSRSFFPYCYVLPLPLLHGSREPPPPRHCRHCECHHHAPPVASKVTPSSRLGRGFSFFFSLVFRRKPLETPPSSPLSPATPPPFR